MKLSTHITFGYSSFVISVSDVIFNRTFTDSFQSTKPTRPHIMSPPASPSLWRKCVERAIGTFVIMFSTSMIGYHMRITDQYPTAWKIANFLILFAFTLWHTHYRDTPRARESHTGQAEAMENEKSSSV